MGRDVASLSLAIQVAGTRAYFSPERDLEDSDYDRQAADMWALGVTLHLATFGCFPNGTGEALPVLHSDFQAPEGTDPAVASLLENLMKAVPSERWKPQEVMQHAYLAKGLKEASEASTSDKACLNAAFTAATGWTTPDDDGPPLVPNTFDNVNLGFTFTPPPVITPQHAHHATSL
jgi:serine/threonine protein kinase